MAGAVEAPGRGRSSCFVEVGRREIGASFPRASSRRISSSESAASPSVRTFRIASGDEVREIQPHIPSTFPRLRKYGRRHREPVAAPTFDDDKEESKSEADDEDEEEAVDEEEFLVTRPKPVGFGVGKTYSTDIEEQLLREMGAGGARRKGELSPGKRRAGSSSDKETSADLSDNDVQVHVWNLPKKKNIHKDLKQAFKGFPGLLTINPAVSANKKTRDPVCKGFAHLKMESVEAATRFVEIYSRKNVSFGKVEKPISCCIVDAQSSTEPSNKGSSSHDIQQSKSKDQKFGGSKMNGHSYL